MFRNRGNCCSEIIRIDPENQLARWQLGQVKVGQAMGRR